MNRAVVAAATVLALAGCDAAPSESGAAGDETAPPLGAVSSVEDLRDALTSAGFDCPRWTQDDAVALAAESGTCDDDSVLSTFASDADLQEQLATSRGLDEMMEDAGIEPNPNLVGPNWILNSPEADAYADALGGTIRR